MSFIKTIPIACLGFFGMIYTMFVVQICWNIFLAGVIGVSEISFFQVFGASLLINFIIDRYSKAKAFSKEVENRLQEQRWNKLFDMIELSIPKENEENLRKYLIKIRAREEDMVVELKDELMPRAIILFLGHLYATTTLLAISFFVSILAHN